MARGDLLILGRQNEEWVPHRLSGGVRHDYHETGMGEGGGPSARRLFTQSDESTGPARPRLTCLGRAVGTNSMWGLFFWWGITNLVFTSVHTRNHVANSLLSD